MSEPVISAASAAEQVNHHAPYKNETRKVLYQAGAIFRAHWLQCILWAVFYIVAIQDWLLLAYYAFYLPGWLVGVLQYGTMFVMPLLLYCLYGWLHRIIAGDGLAIKGLFDPFRWVKSQSFGRFLGICLTLFAAFYVRDMLKYQIPNQVIAIFEPLHLITFFTPDPFAPKYWLQIPLLNIPILLLLQWAVDFYCIHAVQGKGRGVRGVKHTAGIFKKVLRVEAHLALRFLLIPYVLYYLTLSLAIQLIGETAFLLYYFLMQYAFMGFGLVYFPISAIARSLILMRQPNIQLSSAENVDFPDIDARYVQKLEDERLADGGDVTLPEEEEPDSKPE